MRSCADHQNHPRSGCVCLDGVSTGGRLLLVGLKPHLLELVTRRRSAALPRWYTGLLFLGELLWRLSALAFVSIALGVDSRRRLSPPRAFLPLTFLFTRGRWYGGRGWTPALKTFAGAPDEGVWGYARVLGPMQRMHALWGRAMTFVTLSLRYAGPRIGVGSEFLRAPAGRCPEIPPRDSSKKSLIANQKPDSQGACVF
jgi:hypothetical protein